MPILSVVVTYIGLGLGTGLLLIQFAGYDTEDAVPAMFFWPIVLIGFTIGGLVTACYKLCEWFKEAQK